MFCDNQCTFISLNTDKLLSHVHIDSNTMTGPLLLRLFDNIDRAMTLLQV